MVQLCRNIKTCNSASDTPLITSLTLRLDTDAFRICDIMKNWVGYNHSIQEMDNTVFPGTNESHKVPKGMNLKKSLFWVTSSGELGWSPPIRLDGPYQVARACLFYKLWTIVLQGRPRYIENPRILPLHITSVTMHTKLAERMSI
jgi:hypothetical protein